jgi:hypothetical protein
MATVSRLEESDRCGMTTIEPAKSPNKGRSMSVLIIAFEAGRWGPARLPKPLHEAGFRVSALCPPDNALAQTRFLDSRFPLHDVKSLRHFQRRLGEVLSACEPELIIPADERVVACLHALVRRSRRRRLARLAPAWIDVVVKSLGSPAHFDEMLLKSETMKLAGSVGVLAPEGRTVRSDKSVVDAVREIGLPLYVKTSFSWAGQGVQYCQTEADASEAVRRAVHYSPFDRVRRVVKYWLSRDWYPVNSPIDAQRAIVGVPAMFSAVAMNGRLLAGFAGLKQQTSYSGGPSSIVWLGANRAIEAASTKMISALGASGFISFDFMIESGTERVFLIECNPRPGQVSHLGSRIGVNLCKALAHELRGERPSRPIPAAAGATVPLFPQEWLRDPSNASRRAGELDAPTDDPVLLKFMIDTCGGGAKAPELALGKVGARVAFSEGAGGSIG